MWDIELTPKRVKASALKIPRMFKLPPSSVPPMASPARHLILLALDHAPEFCGLSLKQSGGVTLGAMKRELPA